MENQIINELFDLTHVLNSILLIILILILNLLSIKFLNLFYVKNFKIVSLLSILFNSFLFGIVVIDLTNGLKFLYIFDNHINVFDSTFDKFFSFIFFVNLLLILILFIGYQRQTKISNIRLNYSSNIKFVNIIIIILASTFFINFLVGEYPSNEFHVMQMFLINTIILLSILLVISYFIFFSLKKEKHNLFWGLNESLINDGFFGYALYAMGNSGFEIKFISEKFVSLYNLNKKELTGMPLIAFVSSNVNICCHNTWSLIGIPEKRDLYSLNFSFTLKEKTKLEIKTKEMSFPVILSLLLPVSMLGDLPNISYLQSFLLREFVQRRLNNVSDFDNETTIKEIVAKMLSKINF